MFYLLSAFYSELYPQIYHAIQRTNNVMFQGIFVIIHNFRRNIPSTGLITFIIAPVAY